MDEGESRIRQEDCSEDAIGSGILTLTNKRIAFEKSRGRIMDFTKRLGETALDVPLSRVSRAWKEGLLMKKVCIEADGKTYKFGVLGTGGWLEDIQEAIEGAR